MQAEQRAPKGAEDFERVEAVWVPYTVHGPQAGRKRKVDVQPDDRYASVDDVADGIVVLVASEWPHLDREGRLHWDRDPFEVLVPLDRAQAIVDAARIAEKITAPERPIRVGDAFLVRGLDLGATSLPDDAVVLDITASARDAAKAALFGAAASTLQRDYADKMKLGKGYEAPEPAPESGYFDIRQQKVGPEMLESY